MRFSNSILNSILLIDKTIIRGITMKRILLYISVFLAALSHCKLSEANPSKKVIVFDMDEVFVNINKWKTGASVLTHALTQMPLFMFKMSTDSRFRKRVNAIFSKKNKLTNPESYNNVSYKLSQLARIYKPLRKIFDSLLISINQTGRYRITEVVEIIKRLKDCGYTVIVATNRDRIGFELTAKKLKFDQLYNGKRLFDAVIVGDAKNFVKETTMNGKRFSKFAPNPAYNDYITHAPTYKPGTAYYKVVRQVVDDYVAKHSNKFDTTSPDILFFDDKKENINGANKSGLNITAYHVPNSGKGKSIHKNICNNLGITL